MKAHVYIHTSLHVKITLWGFMAILIAELLGFKVRTKMYLYQLLLLINNLILNGNVSGWG